MKRVSKKGENVMRKRYGWLVKMCIRDRLLSSNEKWFGVTYQEDKPGVKAGIKALVDKGLYPSDLWK